MWPTQTTTWITSRFGVLEDVRNNRPHAGLDIGAPGGSQILSVADGKVVKVAYDPKKYGNYIVIEQKDGLRAWYGHMQEKSFLKPGTKVKAGDLLGMVGSTGHSTGNHLHLELRKGSQLLDPLLYFPALGR